MTTGGSIPEATYSPGSWVALAASNVWLLVDIDPANPAVQRWWDALRDGASVDDVLGLLVQEGFRAIQSFALAGYGNGSGSLVLRGTAVARLVANGDVAELHGAGVATWCQHELDASLATMVLAAPDATALTVQLPLASGVSMASTIEINFDGRSKSIDPPASSADVDLVSVGAPGALDPSVDGEQPIVVSSDPGPVTDESVPEAVPTFDHLFGATQRPPLESQVPSAAEAGRVGRADAPRPEAIPISPLSTDPGIETLSSSDQQLPGPPPPPPPASLPAPASPPRSAPSTPGLIDALPWQVDGFTAGSPAAAAPAPPLAPPPAYVAPPAGAVDIDATVNRAALLAAAEAQPSHTGPTVHAVLCPAGHMSPAHADTCRICHAQLPPQGAITAPRPLLGALRLSTGDFVTLDRGVVLGRAPEAPQGNDPDRPHVVQIASPENDISRTHLEVRLDGWHVLVTDLDSTNGTVVTLPGQPPLRLRANDPMAIEPGTVVSLADEVTFVYEVSF
jgi:hypothetical protein